MLIEGSYKLDDYNPKEDKMPEQINEEDNEDSDSSKDKKKKKKKKSKKWIIKIEIQVILI